MGKNIVICFDGTNNQFGENNTNIVKLYDSLAKNEGQVAFYDPGIGTIGPTWMARLISGIFKVICLATGYGISDNIKDGYKFLMDHYNDGDKIFIYGFSRGAYTARSLAGMIHQVGILDKGLPNQIDYAYKMYTDERNHIFATDFKKTYCQRTPSVYLIGVFDTVGSLAGKYLATVAAFLLGIYLAPILSNYISIPYIEKVSTPITALTLGLIFYFWRFPARFIEKTILGSHLFHDTKLSDQVKYGFHALAIDELRWLYSPTLWDESTKAQGQIIEQVWFSGVHVDVGGYYKEHASTSDNALAWMLNLSEKAGLNLKDINSRPQLTPKSDSSLSQNHWAWFFIIPKRRPIAKGSKIHRSSNNRTNNPSPWYPKRPDLSKKAGYLIVHESEWPAS